MYVLQQRKQSPKQIHITISTEGYKSSEKFKVERSDTHYTFQQPCQENEEEEQEQEEQSLDEIYSQLKGADVSRSKSDTKPASVEDDINVVEARSPATLREGKVSVTEDEEVDAKADDFINKFKQQLKLQRLEWEVKAHDFSTFPSPDQPLLP
ncbi:hypothetical protein CMV_008136 [Castanea mollissima]|uniref:Uncharacterized protein n=1 Tax=Castanea mollissima TaxID=60419 RepID=A0A8J4VS42_9ROSI|nr:hypothetical protein CMV_008136 [Castanea mollissima]